MSNEFNTGEFIADQLGECCICHLCGEPIVGEIVSLGGGTVACDYCANVYHDESGEWEQDMEEDYDPRFDEDYDPRDMDPADCEPDYDEYQDEFDYYEHDPYDQ